MPRQRSEALAHELQEAITQIRGVNAARVILDDQDHISEIHLVSSSSRLPKQIVRDTESLLHAHFGIHVDYRRISLVQLGTENVSAVQTRLQFVSARPCPQRPECVQVVLQTEHGPYQGVVAVNDQGQGDAKACAAAEATVVALREIVGPIVHLGVQAVQATSLNGHQICLVMVRALAGPREELLTGTCVIGHNVFEAASKATLDAVNRRLPIWVKERHNGGVSAQSGLLTN